MTESSTERTAGHPIAFEDVRVGDTIERRWTSKGVAYSERGTVAKIDGSHLDTAEGGAIVYQYRSRELLLIDRPKPQLPIEAGSVIVNATIRGVPGQVAVWDGGYWVTFPPVAGRPYHCPEHITDWTLGKVVPA